MEDESSSSQWPIFYECPACRREVEAVAGDQAQLIHCPHCQVAFVIASEDGSTAFPDEEQKQEERSRQEELDGLKIRQLSKMRRAIIRSQSYCIVVAAGCLVGTAQLIVLTVKSIRAHAGALLPIAYLLFAIVLLGLAWHFGRMAAAYYRESRKQILPEPAAPPDFTNLGDGSQTVKNLENIK